MLLSPFPCAVEWCTSVCLLYFEISTLALTQFRKKNKSLFVAGHVIAIVLSAVVLHFLKEGSEFE